MITISKKSIATLALWLGLATSVSAQTEPLTIVVGYAPGGYTDIMARQLATALREQTGREVTVKNQGGNRGGIAATAVADGSTGGNTVLLHQNYFESAKAASLIPLVQICEIAVGVWRSAVSGGNNVAFSSADPTVYANPRWMDALTGGQHVAVPYAGTGPAMTAVKEQGGLFVAAMVEGTVSTANRLGLTLIASSSQSVAAKLGINGLRTQPAPETGELIIPVGLYVSAGTDRSKQNELRDQLLRVGRASSFEAQMKSQYCAPNVREGAPFVAAINSFIDIVERAVPRSNGTIAPAFRPAAAARDARPALTDDPKSTGRGARGN